MIVYDIETLRGPAEVEGGWDDPYGMGFGSAVTFDTDEDRFQFWTAPDASDLIDFLDAEEVLSFNGIKFDNRVLLGNHYLERKGSPWFDFDLLEMVINARFEIDGALGEGRVIPEAVKRVGAKAVFDGSCSLDNLCWHTLGRRKTGSGAHAPELIKAGRWTELWPYNLQDVRLTWALFQFWDQYQFVIDGQDRVIRKSPLSLETPP